MGWWSDFKEDVERYRALDQGSAWKLILTEQGLWALFQYRMEAAVFHSDISSFVKMPLRMILMIWHKLIEIFTGISLPCTAQIGPGVHLPHCGSRILHSAAKIGAHCSISQGVTIGVSGRGERRGVPVVGDRVYFGVNAVVVGKITVGNDVVVGANSLVNRDVSPGSTVLGVPACVINKKGSSDYVALKNGSYSLHDYVPSET